MKNHLLFQRLSLSVRGRNFKVIGLSFLLLFYVFLDTAWSQASYPFPQELPYTYGHMPTNKNSADAQAAYDAWKTNFVVSGCGSQRVVFDYYPGTTRGATDRSVTVSEGIGYGMLLAAYAGDQTLFANLWTFYKGHRNGNGVMNWKIQNCGTANGGANGATDAELDVAMALVVASYQWQSDAYLNDAKNLIRIIREKEFDGYIQKPGDMFGGSNLVNPSYFSPAYYRVFANLDAGNSAFWLAAADKGYDIIEIAGGSTGLVPDWCNASGGVSSAAGSYEDQGKNFIFDAVRTPMRTALDYLWHGNTRAKAYCVKFSTWLKGKHPSPSGIGSKYGTALNGNEGQVLAPYKNNAFLGCFGVATMAADGVSGIDAYTDQIYTENKNQNPAYGEYFNATLKAITLFIETGNFYLPPPDACTSPDLGIDKSLCQGSPLTLDAGVTGRTYVWKRNGTTMSNTTQAISVSQAGEYEVIAKDPSGCTRRDKVNVYDATIKADFTASVQASSVVLTSTSTGGVSNYSWEYAGTAFATTKAASHNFPTSGSYVITLKIDNSGFGCSATDEISKTVVVGGGEGWVADDFTDHTFSEPWIDANNSAGYAPMPLKWCSREDWIANNKLPCTDPTQCCSDLPCSLFSVNCTDPIKPYSPFGVNFRRADAPLTVNIDDIPYVSFKVHVDKAMILGVGLNDGALTTDRIQVALPANKDTIINLDFSTHKTGYVDNENSAVPVDFTKIGQIAFFPYEFSPTFTGKIDIDWIIVGGKTLEPPVFNRKEDADGFLVYEDPDGDSVYTPVPSWDRDILACAGTTTDTVRACGAQDIRWYSGSTQIGVGAISPELAPGKYYVNLINQSGVTVDSVNVKGSDLAASFSYAIEDKGLSVRLFNSSTDFDSFTWDYDIVPADPDAVTWETGYNYYTTEGTYHVCLTVTNALCGKSDSACKDIVIKCDAPLDPISGFASSPDAVVSDTIVMCPNVQETISIDALANASNYGWFGINPASLGSSYTISRVFTESQWLKVEAYNVCGETVRDSVYIKVLPDLVAQFTYESLGGNKFGFTADWVGDAPDVTYTWKEGTTTMGTGVYLEYTFPTGGSHDVTLMVHSPCGDEEVTINLGCTLPDLSGVAITGKTSVCVGETCTSYSITGATGVTDGYTWSLPGTGTICTGDGTSAITATINAAGNITVVGNNACGASAPVTLAVSVNSGPTAATISGSATPPCSGANVPYSVVGGIGSTYQWAVPADATITGGTGTKAISVTFGTTNGNISVVETNASGCEGPVNTLPISLSGCNLKADFTASATTVCPGVTVTYTNTSTGTSTGTTYSWNFGSGATPATGTGAGPFDVTYSTSGSKQVTLTVTEGVQATKINTVTVNPLPSATGTISGNTPVCEGDPQVYSIAPVTNTTGYTWTVPSGATFTGSGTDIVVTFGSTSGAVSVTPMNACGAGTPSLKTVSVNPAPATSAITGTATPGCGSSAQAYSVTGLAGSSFNWTVPTGASIATGQGSNTVSINFGSANGDIVVTETSSLGCVGTPQKKTITLAGCSMKADFSTSLTSVCEGSSVTFTDISTGTTGGATYAWDFGAGATPATATTKGPHTVTYSGAGLKTVSLTVTDGATSTESKPNLITVNPKPSAAGTISGSALVCANSTQTYSISAVSNATSYTWTGPVGAVVTPASNGLSASVVFGTTSGKVTVTPTNTCGNGTASSVDITVNAIPATAAIAGNATPACSASGEVYSVTATSGSTYDWSVPSGATIVSGVGTNSITVDFGSANGDVSVTETNASGCAGIAKTKSITLAGCGLAADFSASSTAVCDGASVTFTNLSTGTSPTSSYTWDFGTGANPATVTGPGPHTVIYSGVSKATVSLEVIEGTTVSKVKTDYITVNPKPSAAGTISGTATVCPNTAGVTYTIPIVSNATGYTWTVPPGATFAGTNNTITVIFGTASGNITVTPTNTCGDGVSSNFVVTVSPAPATSAIVGDAAPVCSATGISYSVTETVGSSYLWTVPSGATIVSGQGSNAITVDFGTSNGKITVLETTASSCVGIPQSLDINLSGCGLKAEFSADNQTSCLGSVVTFTNLSTADAGATYTWDFGAGASPSSATGPGPHNVTYNTSGTKDVSLTVTEGAASDTKNKAAYITVGDVPGIAGTLNGATTVCSNGIEKYSVAPVSGAVSYVWTLPSGATASGTTNMVDITFGSTSGTVSVAAKNACGISTASSMAVSVGSSVIPAVSISVPSTTINSGEKITFTATPTNGGASPIYYWFVNDTPVAQGFPTYSTTTLADGDAVKVAIKSSSSCANPTNDTSSVIIMTVNTPPPGYASAGQDQEICATVASLEGNIPDCGTGEWSIVSGSGNIIQKTNPASKVTALAIGDNVLRWTVTGTCGTQSDDVTITVKAPSVTLSPLTGTHICEGSQISFSATPVYGGTTPSYQWLVNNNNVGTNSPTFTSSSLSDNDNVSVKLTSSGTCSATVTSKNTVTVQVDALPLAPDAGPDQYVNVDNAIMAAVEPLPPSKGGWSLVSGTGALSDDSSASAGVSGLTIGANTFKWSVKNGMCPVVSDNVTLNRGNKPSSTSISGPKDVAANSKVTYTLVGAPSQDTYTWTVPAGATIVSGWGTPSIVVQYGSAVSPGSISVVEKNEYGTTTSSLPINSGDAPSTKTITGPSVVGVGATAEYYITDDGNGSSYTWTVPAGATIISGQGSAKIKVTFTIALTGTITVKESNPFGDASSSKGVTASDSPVSQQIIGPSAVQPNSDAVYSLPSNPGSTYDWNLPAGASIVSTSSDKSSITVHFGPSVSGDISVTETRNGQSATSSLAVNTTSGIVSQIDGLTFDLYPNPFNKQTTFRINAVENNFVTIRIVDANGLVVSDFKEYRTNESINLGGELPSGVYTIQVSYGDKYEFLKMVKIQ